MKSDTGLAISGLTKCFGKQQVLKGIDLAVGPGSITAVLGPSGCGKTTLLRIIAGFETADAGTVSLAGSCLVSDAKCVPANKRRIGLMPQEGALFPHLTVGQNISFGIERRSRRAEAVEDWLKLVGLEGLAGQRPDQLSGGQQQRVALARALAGNPQLLLLDEPFSSLDAALRVRVREEIAWVMRDAGTTAVLVTHDQAEALSLADTVALLIDGQLAQVGPPADLYHRPATLAAAAFVGETVQIPGDVTGGVVMSILGPKPARIPVADGPAVVVLRPEQVQLVTEPDVGVAATVLEHRYYGPDTLLRTRLPDGSIVSVHCPGYEPAEPGAKVHLAVTGDVLAYSAS